MERLFWSNQFMVAAAGMNGARAACVGAAEEHFLAWKDTSPVPMAEVAKALGKARLNAQETLVAGMLRPQHLLDLVRHFIAFKTSEGRTFKIVARYQQFRAVQEAARRLLTGQVGDRARGILDRRGGIIWHTQGSGKSIVMVLLAKWILENNPSARVGEFGQRTAACQRLVVWMREDGKYDSPGERVAGRRPRVHRPLIIRRKAST